MAIIVHREATSGGHGVLVNLILLFIFLLLFFLATYRWKVGKEREDASEAFLELYNKIDTLEFREAFHRFVLADNKFDKGIHIHEASAHVAKEFASEWEDMVILWNKYYSRLFGF